MATVVLAAASFNNWILAIIFNRKLLFDNGAVSEFSSVGQQNAVVFRIFDVFAGFLLIFCAFLIFVLIRSSSKSVRLFALFTAILGAANIVDALFPLKCAQAVSSSCVIPFSLSLSHFQIPSHAYSSIVIAVSYFVLPLCGWFYIRGKGKNLKLKILNGAALLMAVLAVGSVLFHYLITGSYNIRGTGASQEIQMLILGVWFVAYCNVIFNGAKPQKTTVSRGLLPKEHLLMGVPN